MSSCCWSWHKLNNIVILVLWLAALALMAIALFWYLPGTASGEHYLMYAAFVDACMALVLFALFRIQMASLCCCCTQTPHAPGSRRSFLSRAFHIAHAVSAQLCLVTCGISVGAIDTQRKYGQLERGESFMFFMAGFCVLLLTLCNFGNWIEQFADPREMLCACDTAPKKADTEAATPLRSLQQPAPPKKQTVTAFDLRNKKKFKSGQIAPTPDSPPLLAETDKRDGDEEDSLGDLESIDLQPLGERKTPRKSKRGKNKNY